MNRARDQPLERLRFPNLLAVFDKTPVSLFLFPVSRFLFLVSPHLSSFLLYHSHYVWASLPADTLKETHRKLSRRMLPKRTRRRQTPSLPRCTHANLKNTLSLSIHRWFSESPQFLTCVKNICQCVFSHVHIHNPMVVSKKRFLDSQIRNGRSEYPSIPDFEIQKLFFDQTMDVWMSTWEKIH